jgi:hypothetical protein
MLNRDCLGQLQFGMAKKSIKKAKTLIELAETIIELAKTFIEWPKHLLNGLNIYLMA